jgi:hypothetical protein
MIIIASSSEKYLGKAKIRIKIFQIFPAMLLSPGSQRGMPPTPQRTMMVSPPRASMHPQLSPRTSQCSTLHLPPLRPPHHGQQPCSPNMIHQWMKISFYGCWPRVEMKGGEKAHLMSSTPIQWFTPAPTFLAVTPRNFPPPPVDPSCQPPIKLAPRPPPTSRVPESVTLTGVLRST